MDEITLYQWDGGSSSPLRPLRRTPYRTTARRHPERETLELATAGAVKVLGADHGVTKALAKASITMDRADLWRARLTVKTLRRDQRAHGSAPAGLLFRA